MEEVADVILIFQPPLCDGSRYALDMRLLVDIVGGQLSQFLELLDHRRDDEIHDATHDGDDHDQRQDDAQGPRQVHVALHELLDRVEQISEEPGDEEWQQYTAQIVDEQQDANVDASGGTGFKSQGLAALKAQQYGQAVAFFESALREDDTDYDLWSVFAEAVAKSGQWRKLTDLEEDLTTLFPQSSALLTALADAFLHDGHPDKAVAYYRQALSFAFDTEQIQNIRKGLYDAYTQMGDAENAARYR